MMPRLICLTILATAVIHLSAGCTWPGGKCGGAASALNCCPGTKCRLQNSQPYCMRTNKRLSISGRNMLQPGALNGEVKPKRMFALGVKSRSKRAFERCDFICASGRPGEHNEIVTSCCKREGYARDTFIRLVAGFCNRGDLAFCTDSTYRTRG